MEIDSDLLTHWLLFFYPWKVTVAVELAKYTRVKFRPKASSTEAWANPQIQDFIHEFFIYLSNTIVIRMPTISFHQFGIVFWEAYTGYPAEFVVAFFLSAERVNLVLSRLLVRLNTFSYITNIVLTFHKSL